MAARALATGNVSFGLVSIPIRLYSSTEHSTSISFNMLDSVDNARVKQQYINPNTGEVVPRDRMIKGYEFAKGQYVTFTEAELKELEERASPSIDIVEFVPLREIDPLFFDKAYFLGPETGGERAYRLLAKAMDETERCALAKYAARGKQYLVMIRPFEDGLLMQQLHYPDEIKAFAEVPLGEDLEIKDKELDLAVQLIEQIANEQFEPGKYEDDVRQRIQEAIAQKVEGREVSEVEAEAPKAQIIDLMEALKASLGQPGRGEGAGRKSTSRADRASAAGASERKAGGRRKAS
ncbi:MAG TPA: Ku protein [Thermoanaerobaculia bacterium]|nr:Ku protein [Thermoanaerobaculia bacterium]